MSRAHYAYLGDETAFVVQRLSNGQYRISLGEVRTRLNQALMPPPPGYTACVEPEALVTLHTMLGDLLGVEEQR